MPFPAGTKRMGRVRVASPSYPIPLSMFSRVHRGSQMMSELVSLLTSLVTPGPLSPLTHPSAPTSLSLILPINFLPLPPNWSTSQATLAH